MSGPEKDAWLVLPKQTGVYLFVRRQTREETGELKRGEVGVQGSCRESPSSLPLPQVAAKPVNSDSNRYRFKKGTTVNSPWPRLLLSYTQVPLSLRVSVCVHKYNFTVFSFIFIFIFIFVFISLIVD